MPNINKSLEVPFSKEQMYSLVNDIEKYPMFLQWCERVEVHEKSDQKIKATLHLAKGPVKQSITTENTLHPANKIIMQYIAGPFKKCEGAWRFVEVEEHKCLVEFNMEYIFKNKLISMAIEPIFGPIADSLISAFCQRARDVYSS